MLMWYMIQEGVSVSAADLYKAAAAMCAVAAVASWELLKWASSEEWW